MRRAIESEPLCSFDLIDINMGCPMPKIVNNGEGSALLENFPLAEKVIAECVKSGKRISVKFRIGVREGDRLAAEFAKLCEGAGACMITVHGRVPGKNLCGRGRFRTNCGCKACRAHSRDRQRRNLFRRGRRTDARQDGSGRRDDRTGGALSSRTVRRNHGQRKIPARQWFPEQLQETKELLGERFATVFMRKMAAFYLKGRANGAEWKRRFFEAQTTDEVLSLARECFENGMIG